jgi:hypothetical protein
MNDLRVNPNSLYKISLALDDIKTMHRREAYTFLAILSHLGGLTRAFTQIFGIFFVVYSQNSLLIELASQLFVLKREDAAIFDSSKASKVESKQSGAETKNDFVDISFDFKTSVELFMLTNFSYLCCFIKNRDKKMKMIHHTNSQVRKHLDSIDIIKKSRYLFKFQERADTP